MYEKEGKQREAEGEEVKINLLAAAAKISSKDKRVEREREQRQCAWEGAVGGAIWRGSCLCRCAGHFHA